MTFSKYTLAGAAIALFSFGAAQATTINVSITNHSPTEGLNLTPLFVAFHNGSFDAFDVGGSATAGVEGLAELGMAGVLAAEALAADPNALTGLVANPDGFAGAPIIDPGETATLSFDVDAMSQRFVTFLSMVIPSNDTFIGNDDSIELFNASGQFLGPQTFNITGNSIWDAGTEQNDLQSGPAFVVGQDGAAGATTMDLIALSEGINALAVDLPNGDILNTLLTDFSGDRDNFLLATVSFSADPVPLPAAFPLMAGVLAAGGVIRQRRKTRA